MRIFHGFIRSMFLQNKKKMNNEKKASLNYLVYAFFICLSGFELEINYENSQQ